MQTKYIYMSVEEVTEYLRKRGVPEEELETIRREKVINLFTPVENGSNLPN